MYHALVRIDGEWRSFGLHIPSEQWTRVFQSLQHLYGARNVAYLFWRPSNFIGDAGNVRDRASEDVRLANRAQEGWNEGQHRELSEVGGPLNLSATIIKLRELTMAAG